MKHKGALIAAVITVALAAAASVSVAVSSAQTPSTGAYALVGTWDVTLTLPGAPPAKVLATFMRDGTTVESAAAPPATRGASHGVWRRIGPNLFAVTRVFFRFNPQTGALLGTTKVNVTVRVAANRQTFRAVSLSELRDPGGAVVATGLRGTAEAVRIGVERIAEQP